MHEFDDKSIKVEQHEEKRDEIKLNFMGQWNKIKGTNFYRCHLATGKIEICPTREQHVLNMMIKGVDTVHKLHNSSTYLYNQSVNLKNAQRKFMKELYPDNYKEILSKMPELREQHARGERILALEEKHLSKLDLNSLPPDVLSQIDNIIYEISATDPIDEEMERGLEKMIENVKTRLP